MALVPQLLSQVLLVAAHPSSPLAFTDLGPLGFHVKRKRHLLPLAPLQGLHIGLSVYREATTEGTCRQRGWSRATHRDLARATHHQPWNGKRPEAPVRRGRLQSDLRTGHHRVPQTPGIAVTSPLHHRGRRPWEGDGWGPKSQQGPSGDLSLGPMSWWEVAPCLTCHLPYLWCRAVAKNWKDDLAAWALWEGWDI